MPFFSKDNTDPYTVLYEKYWSKAVSPPPTELKHAMIAKGISPDRANFLIQRNVKKFAKLKQQKTTVTTLDNEPEDLGD